MNSKIYQKPSFEMAKIEMNDLCSASEPGPKTRVKVDQGSKLEYGYAMPVNNGTENMWDNEF